MKKGIANIIFELVSESSLRNRGIMKCSGSTKLIKTLDQNAKANNTQGKGQKVTHLLWPDLTGIAVCWRTNGAWGCARRRASSKGSHAHTNHCEKFIYGF
jgi:hypothetical protein